LPGALAAGPLGYQACFDQVVEQLHRGPVGIVDGSLIGKRHKHLTMAVGQLSRGAHELPFIATSRYT